MIIVSPIIRIVLKTASFILFVFTIAAAYGGHCNPQYFTLPSVLVLALPYLAIATLLAGLAWIASGRFIMGALAAGTLFASWATLKDVTPIAFANSPEHEERTFRIITFNCLHLADTTKSHLPGNRAISYLIDSGADIICLQELKNLEDSTEIHHWSRTLMDSLYAVYPYRGGRINSDLKILSKYPVTPMEAPYENSEEEEYWRHSRRWQMFEVDIYGIKLPVLNFHMPSYELTDSEREVVTEIKGVRSAKKSYREFRSEIFPKLGAAFRTRALHVEELARSTTGINPIIACGDFNDVAGSWSYRIMRKAGFKDAYPETNFGPVNTFNQFMFLFHIDQIFYRGKQLRAIDVRRLPLNTSDHYPMEVTFELISE